MCMRLKRKSVSHDGGGGGGLRTPLVLRVVERRDGDDESLPPSPHSCEPIHSALVVPPVHII